MVQNEFFKNFTAKRNFDGCFTTKNEIAMASTKMAEHSSFISHIKTCVASRRTILAVKVLARRVFLPLLYYKEFMNLHPKI